MVNRKPAPRNPANRTPPEIVEKVLHLRRTYHLEPIRRSRSQGQVEAATRLQLLDRHTGRGQGLGVGDAFVTQWIELGRHNERRRQALRSAAQC
jgi:hypothetical protein